MRRPSTTFRSERRNTRIARPRSCCRWRASAPGNACCSRGRASLMCKAFRRSRCRRTSKTESPPTGRFSRAGGRCDSRFPARRGGAAALGRIRARLTMYVAVKGGARAIENAHALLADVRRGDRSVAEISLEQISQQLALAVDRVMAEGSLYDRELAALAIKQARGDLIEAIFLLRAF